MVKIKVKLQISVNKSQGKGFLDGGQGITDSLSLLRDVITDVIVAAERKLKTRFNEMKQDINEKFWFESVNSR